MICSDLDYAIGEGSAELVVHIWCVVVELCLELLYAAGVVMIAYVVCCSGIMSLN